MKIPHSKLIDNVEDGLAYAEHIGYPIKLWPSFTLHRAGSGIAYNREELVEIMERGLALSPVHKVLIEESDFSTTLIRTVVVEHSLVDLAMAYLRGDDANPDVGMGMFPAVALDMVLKDHNLTREDVPYEELVDEIYKEREKERW